MKRNGKRTLFVGIMLVATFVIWTMLIQHVDVKAAEINGTIVGFATLNIWFHKLTGVHMTMYTITDWLGLVPIFVCMVFAGIGLCQLIKRRNLLKVDFDILFLGVYYVMVIFCYLFFEMFPVNFRPVLIEGFIEASYPSSTTLLVLCVMPTLTEQAERRVQSQLFERMIKLFVICFSAFMVLGRLVSGVHWLTDIVGSLLLSAGLFGMYKAVVLLGIKEDN